MSFTAYLKPKGQHCPWLCKCQPVTLPYLYAEVQNNIWAYMSSCSPESDKLRQLCQDLQTRTISCLVLLKQPKHIATVLPGYIERAAFAALNFRPRMLCKYTVGYTLFTAEVTVATAISQKGSQEHHLKG